jgi:RNA-directed DNA polymerase
MMHGPEKSDLAILAGKPANKAEQPAPERSAAELNAAELVERRAGTKGNASQQSTCRTQSRISVSQALTLRRAKRLRRGRSSIGFRRYLCFETKFICNGLGIMRQCLETRSLIAVMHKQRRRRM